MRRLLLAESRRSLTVSAKKPSLRHGWVENIEKSDPLLRSVNGRLRSLSGG